MNRLLRSHSEIKRSYFQIIVVISLELIIIVWVSIIFFCFLTTINCLNMINLHNWCDKIIAEWISFSIEKKKKVQKENGCILKFYFSFLFFWHALFDLLLFNVQIWSHLFLMRVWKYNYIHRIYNTRRHKHSYGKMNVDCPTCVNIQTHSQDIFGVSIHKRWTPVAWTPNNYAWTADIRTHS